MSTQAITDYLTKQIFIERNIVTFRSLSRHFSIHVNTAKNELATFHHNAQYQPQQSSAMFVLSGVPARQGSAWAQSQDYSSSQPRTQDEDVDMDAFQTETTQLSELNGHTAATDKEDEESDTEETEEKAIMLVNEKDLEGAKARYLDIHSIHVYSLAPAPLIDAALICDQTEQVRAIDRSKGLEWTSEIGRLVGVDIKMGASKKGKPPVVAPPAAGPSRVKPSGPSAPLITGSSTTGSSSKLVASRTEPRIKNEPSVSGFYADKGKEKAKGNGKLNFFAKPKDGTATSLSANTAETEKDKEQVKAKDEPQAKIKKANSVVDTNKKMFFSSAKVASGSKDERETAPAQTKALPTMEKQETPPFKIGPPRGVKRKPSAALNTTSRERTPDNPAVAKEKDANEMAVKASDKGEQKLGETASSGTRRRGKKILSEDEDEEMEAKPKRSRRAQSRASLTSDSDRNAAVDSEAERQGRALMEMDDDQVERISHAPSTVVSSSDTSFGEGGGTASEMDEDASIPHVKAEDSDGDIDMDDDVAAKPKPKKRKPKAVVPMGRNGIKKRKVTKTRSVKDAKGYLVKQDYSDWESVEEGGGEEKPELKAPKVVKEKKEEKKKPKLAAPAVKKEQEDVTENGIEKATEEPEKEKEPKEKKPNDKKKVEKDKPSKPAKKPAGNVKTQKGMMMNFFKKS